MLKDYNQQKISVRLAVKTPEVNRSLEEIVSTLECFELQRDEKATHADILVLEVGDNPTTEFSTVRSMLKDGVVGNVFLTSTKTTTDILLPALRTGAKQFFKQPLVFAEIKQAFNDVLEENRIEACETVEEKKEPGKIISLLGAKGGVGTTTVAVNLAESLNRLYPEKTVALVDMNRLLGEITVFLDLQTEFSWDELVKNINRLDAAFLSRALIKYAPGFYVMPAPNRIDLDTHLSSKLIEHVLQTTRNAFDFVVVDTGTRVDKSAFKIFNISDSIYLISILSLPCIINVKRLIATMRVVGRVPMDKIRIIANRFEKKSAISFDDAEEMMGHSIFSTLPNEYQQTMEAINAGKPLVEVAKKSRLVKSLNQLAESVPAGEAQGKKRKGWLW